MTKIANPIYDVVFKYLLSDNKIAKLLISNLIGVEISSLELRPQEFSTNPENKTVTVYRIDFKAEIVLKNGEKLVVLIEIQKAKFTTDLIRFRRYLGEQYASSNNTTEKDDKKMPLPIITIYFLGYGLDNNKDIPIIRVKRHYLDNHNGDMLVGEEMFIETLTHDSIIVQIPALKKQRRNDLEKALSVFEADKIQEVSINEDDYPEKYKPVIRQLIKAIANEQIRKTMDIEDEILDDNERKERLILRQKKEIVETKEELVETKEMLAEKDKKLTETKEDLAEKDKKLAEKEKIINKLMEELNKLKK